MIGRALAFAALLPVLALPASAQVQYGNLYGTVKSGKDKGLLPGATITLTGVGGAPLVQTTNTLGRFRFLRLAPGDYTFDAELDYYSPIHLDKITINAGRKTFVEVTLALPENIDIETTEGHPWLDPDQWGKHQTITQEELQSVPTARDPWAVLASTPGVLTDRVNVGGNESGQQPGYVGPGSPGDQAVWSLDGMVITDMTALGSSPTYYDFDAFEKMEVTTGGSDASIATGGMVLNLVTKRGTDEWRGSSRYYVDEKSSDRNEEHGAELGGPIRKDRLWAWGSYSRRRIDLSTIDDLRDKTTLENWNGKLNAQLSSSNSATVLAANGDKTETGRNASPLRPQETTWDQSNFGPSPTLLRAEDTQVHGDFFYVTGLYAVVNSGFELVPAGGGALAYRDLDQVWHNSFSLHQVERPQRQAKADASNLLSNYGALSHVLKYGGAYRTAEQSSLFSFQAGGIDVAQAPAGPDLLILTRDARPKSETDYTSAYVQDTLMWGRLTADVGLRYDRQGGRSLASTVRANPVFPDLLPAVHSAGQDAGFTWTTIAPRLGLTYAPGGSYETLLRASYSRFADQLGNGTASFLDPVAAGSYRYFLTDNHGDPHLGPGDLGPEVEPPSGNVNPITLQPLRSNAVNPNLSAPVTDEILLSATHALTLDFVVGLDLTYRTTHGILDAERLVFDTTDPRAPAFLGSVGRPARRGDYVEAPPVTVIAPDGRAYTVHYWELRPGVTTRNGYYLTNGDREQEFKGVSLKLDRRLSGRWMMRGDVSWQDWRWRIPAGESQDPTDTVAGGVVDGTEVLQGSGIASGPQGNVFINSRWSYNLNGLYQVAPGLPWGFNVAASLTGRQGYPIRYAARIVRSTLSDNGGAGLYVPVDPSPDAFRYPDVHVLSLRVEKEFPFSKVDLKLGADVFNALNESYVLQRQGVLGQSNSGSVLEVLSPRVFRLGVRVAFR